MKAIKETRDAFKEVEKCVIACADTNGRLAWINVEDLIDNKGAVRTERRISIPTKIALAGWNT
jgi:hypothetical protein